MLKLTSKQARDKTRLPRAAAGPGVHDGTGRSCGPQSGGDMCAGAEGPWVLTLQASEAHASGGCRQPRAAASTCPRGPAWILAGLWSRGPLALWAVEQAVVRQTRDTRSLSSAQRSLEARSRAVSSGRRHGACPSSSWLLPPCAGPQPTPFPVPVLFPWPLGTSPLPGCEPALTCPAPEQMSMCPQCHRLLS